MSGRARETSSCLPPFCGSEMRELSRRLEELPVVGIVRRCPAEQLMAVVEAAMKEGLTVVEVTFDSPGAPDQIATLRKAFPDVVVGAGTVTSVEELEQTLEAGATFVVTPVLSEEVVEACVTRGIPCIPGASTPTEIWRAAGLGALAVKVFPAAQLGGPGYLAALREPLEGIRLVPTGGVTADAARAYRDAGAWALGVGSTVFSSRWMAEGDLRSIGQAMSSFREALG